MGRQYGRSWPGVSILRSLLLPLLPSNESRHCILAAAFFEVFLYGKALNATHHWFSILIAGYAVLICLDRISTKRIFISGALLGLSAFFTQTHAVAFLAAFLTFLFLKHKRQSTPVSDLYRGIGSLLAGFVLVLILLFSHAILTAGLERVWFCNVTYVLKYGPLNRPSTRLGLTEALTLQNLPKMSLYLWVYIALPIAYGISLWRCWRYRNDSRFPWSQVALLSLAGLAVFGEVAVSINWLRLFAVSLPGVILLFWLLGPVLKNRRYVTAGLWIAILVLAMRQIQISRANYSVRADLPAGQLAITPKASEKLAWVSQHTQPGEYFLQAH